MVRKRWQQVGLGDYDPNIKGRPRPFEHDATSDANHEAVSQAFLKKIRQKRYDLTTTDHVMDSPFKNKETEAFQNQMGVNLMKDRREDNIHQVGSEACHEVFRLVDGCDEFLEVKYYPEEDVTLSYWDEDNMTTVAISSSIRAPLKEIMKVIWEDFDERSLWTRPDDTNRAVFRKIHTFDNQNDLVSYTYTSMVGETVGDKRHKIPLSDKRYLNMLRSRRIISHYGLDHHVVAYISANHGTLPAIPGAIKTVMFPSGYVLTATAPGVTDVVFVMQMDEEAVTLVADDILKETDDLYSAMIALKLKCEEAVPGRFRYSAGLVRQRSVGFL